MSASNLNIHLNILFSHHESNRFMKKFKQAKTSEREDGVDMISKLPNDILQKILSGIPSTEEVIRTSILSTRWRHMWTSIPFIDIDCTRKLNPEMELESNGFKEFLYWVLLNKPMDLDSFCLQCLYHYNMSTVRRWIHAAVVRKVKLLDLTFCPIDESEDLELPHCLVTCGSLEVLKLCLMGYRLCLPKITGFSALRVLELNDVLLNEAKVVEYFLESCLLLEDLSLLHCDANSLVISSPNLKNLRIEKRFRIYDEETNEFIDDRRGESIEISCPNLVYLKLTGSLAYELLFESLHSLKEVVIHLDYLFESDEGVTFDFFKEISHVESLSINLYSCGQCYDPGYDEPIFLPNLKTLEITVDSLHGIIPFLKCVPDLESLHLVIAKDNIYFVHEWNLQEAATMSILTRHLKKVEFLEIDDEKSTLVVARALLEHGNELEEMVFSWDNEAMFHERAMETMNEVLNFHKASSTVNVTAVFDPS